MIVVRLVIAAVAGDVGVAGAVDAVAVAVAAVASDIGIDFDSEFGVGVQMFDIDEMEAAEAEEVVRKLLIMRMGCCD